MENREDIERLAEKAIPLLKEVIGKILSAFGVIYTWVSLALGNPVAQIGAGVGGFVGGLTSFCLMFSVNSERIHSHRKLFTVISLTYIEEYIHFFTVPSNKPDSPLV